MDVAEDDAFDLDEVLGTANENGDSQTNGHADTIISDASLPYLLTTMRLPTRLTSLAQLTLLSFPPALGPSSHPPITSILSVLHLRALEALNNLLLTTAAYAAAGGRASTVPVSDLWTGLFAVVDPIFAEPQVMQARGQEMRLEVLETATGCLWSLAKISSKLVRSLIVINQI